LVENFNTLCPTVDVNAASKTQRTGTVRINAPVVSTDPKIIRAALSAPGTHPGLFKDPRKMITILRVVLSEIELPSPIYLNFNPDHKSKKTMARHLSNAYRKEVKERKREKPRTCTSTRLNKFSARGALLLPAFEWRQPVEAGQEMHLPFPTEWIIVRAKSQGKAGKRGKQWLPRTLIK
jgi:hypothetical protein